MVNSALFCSEQIYPQVWKITNCFNDHSILDTFTFLVEGDERALVIDTMFGWGNLKGFCRELTSKPLTVVLTHYHGDHSGGIFDFDECYIHEADIVDLYKSAWGIPHEKRYERMLSEALPEYKGKITPDDISREHNIKVIPIKDGDIFDLGGRLIEVLHVGGHSPGCIALLDRNARIAFTGDCCNSNTILSGPTALSVEEYLDYLHHFKSFQPYFDVCEGAHDKLFPKVIDEGIEICTRVLDGTDDHDEKANRRGGTHFYGRKLPDGKLNGLPFNIAYVSENIHRPKEKRYRVFPL